MQFYTPKLIQEPTVGAATFQSYAKIAEMKKGTPKVQYCIFQDISGWKQMLIQSRANIRA